MGVSARFIHEGLERFSERYAGRVFSVDNNHRWPPDDRWPLRVVVDSDCHDPTLPQKLQLAGLQKARWSFIDGDHSRRGVKADTETALAFGADLLLYHDFGPNTPPHNPVTNDGADVRPYVIEIFDTNEGFWDLFEIRTFCGMALAVRKGI